MTSLINALDSFTPKQLGENAHLEYGWSLDLQESITQLFFQLVRSDDYTNVSRKFQDLLIKSKSSKNNLYFITLCKIVVQTRDLEGGKGEYRLAWNLLQVLDKIKEYQIVQKIIYYLVYNLPIQENSKDADHPFGSWKDIKYLWSEFTWSKETSIYMIKLVNTAVKQDYELLLDNKKPKTLVGKWVPRESSKFKKMFKALALDYFSEYLNTTCENKNSFLLAKKKCYSNYRKIISALNKSLLTVQINQCGGTWNEIDYDKNVTSITLSKQCYAFRNKTKKMEQRSEEEDRILAGKKFEDWLNNKIANKETIKGKRVGLIDLVNKAFNINSDDESLINQLNMQWEDAGKNLKSLENMIACVDVSGSMMGNPMSAAIGLGIRVSEKSKLGRRILTFSANPEWHVLPEPDSDGKTNFVNDVKIIKQAHWGMNTNFTAMLKLILDGSVQKKLSSEEVSQMTLAVFSDMQIDYGSNEQLTDSMWEHIERLYKTAGYDKVPHILFWNLRSTSGFPVLSSQKNVSMFSGFSPVLLNLFCEKGIDFLNNATPWSQLIDILKNKRYDIF